MKKLISMMLVISVFLCGLIPCAAVSDGKQYRDYKVYTLLGDSVASGYDDVEKDSTSCQFKYKEGGYGAKVAKALGIKINSMACPAVRTVEMRYLLEDDYPEDDYMFYGIAYDWKREGFKQEYRDAISEADIITLGIGGNDYLTYLVWIFLEEMDKKGLGVHKELVDKLMEAIGEDGLSKDTAELIYDIASAIDALPEAGQIIPFAFMEALRLYYENWGRVIEGIYSYNEDVELYVIGGLNYSTILEDGYDTSSVLNNIGRLVADLGNKPQIEGAEKYGYTYVSTLGIDCVLTHPTPDGYTQIAERILDVLPDAGYSYTDAAQGSKYYDAVYYMYRNGYMKGISDTEFGVKEKLTAGQLAQALYNIAGETQGDAFTWAKENGITVKEADSSLGYFDLIKSLNSFSRNQGRTDFFHMLRFVIFTVKNMFSEALFGSVTRGNGAILIRDYCTL